MGRARVSDLRGGCARSEGSPTRYGTWGRLLVLRLHRRSVRHPFLRSGIKWTASFDRLSPFNRHPDTHGEHLLPASTLYEWYRVNRLPSTPTYSITWPEDDDLNRLLWLWFGHFGKEEVQQADARQFEALAQPCALGPALPLPPHPMSMPSQLTITMQDVFHRSRWFRTGVVEIDTDDVAELILFWN